MREAGTLVHQGVNQFPGPLCLTDLQFPPLTFSGSPPGWDATAIRSPSRPRRSPAWKTLFAGIDSRDSQGSLASSGPGVRSRRRLPEAVPPGRGRKTGAVYPGGRRLDPQRKQQGRRILGRLRHRSANRPTDHHLPVDRPACSASLGGRGVRHVRRPMAAFTRCRATRPAAGTGRLSRLELAVAGRHSAGLRPRLSRPARQLHGSCALPAQSGGRAGPP